MSPANISHRLYLYPLPYPIPPNTPLPYTSHLPTDLLSLGPIAPDPTSTLVLTTPSNHYLDTRIFLPLPPPNTGIPLTSLHWAFAGHSTSKILNPDTGMKHSTWHHWLDSRFHAGAKDIPVDEGDMYPIPSFHPAREIEVGASRDPLTGKMVAYEEGWEDIPITTCAPEKAMWSVVLRVEDLANGVRGMVVRVGQFVQGLVRVGEAVAVERWEWVGKGQKGEEVDGDWTRVVRLGDLFLPCAVAMKTETLQTGMTVKHGDLTWTVQEVVQWTDLD